MIRVLRDADIKDVGRARLANAESPQWHGFRGREKTPKTVIPSAGFARGIRFFPVVYEKTDPSLRSG
jgi:hypothetical protein